MFPYILQNSVPKRYTRYSDVSAFRTIEACSKCVPVPWGPVCPNGSKTWLCHVHVLLRMIHVDVTVLTGMSSGYRHQVISAAEKPRTKRTLKAVQRQPGFRADRGLACGGRSCHSGGQRHLALVLLCCCQISISLRNDFERNTSTDVKGVWENARLCFHLGGKYLFLKLIN